MIGHVAGAPRTDRPRVLLVEDDAGVRRSLQLLLQAKGFDVRAYAAGGSLLADPLALNAACFVADYRMVDLDGLMILEQLRGRGWNGPAILITAFPSRELSERAIQVGFHTVIDKPFREYALVETVQQLVAQYTPTNTFPR